MRKKLLALLTSAVCCSVCVGNLPVSAKKTEGLEELYQKDYYIVTFTNTNPENDSYYVRCNSKAMYGRQWHTYLDSDSVAITGEKISGFSYGDILLVDAFTVIQESYPPTYITYADSAEYIGNCRDILETKELTLTSKEITYSRAYWEEEGTFDSIEHIKFNFTDEDGEEYYYICYYYNGDPEVDVNICNIGDKILASVYKDVVILPLEVYPDTTDPLPGDVDGNGIVDITDVIRMNRVYVGCQKFTPEQIKAGDVDHDGKISLSDSMQVLRYLVGLVETLGV